MESFWETTSLRAHHWQLNQLTTQRNHGLHSKIIWAYYHYVRLQSSKPDILEGLDLWRATVVKYESAQHKSAAEDVPWHNADALYETIDSIQAGDALWKSYRFSYTGPKCYVEFVLEHSLSISVRLCLFPSVLRPSIMFLPAILSFSVPFLLHPCPYYVSVLSVSSFQLSTLGSDLFPVSSDLAFILFLLLFGYNPYQPNPIAPRFLIVFCSLLSYDPFVPIVPICINYDKL